MQTGKRIELPQDLINSNDAAIEAFFSKTKINKKQNQLLYAEFRN